MESAEMIRKLEQPQLLEVLDRILDKGIVIDAWIRFSLAGLDFLTLEARIVVASIETYLEYAPALRTMLP
jgi:gas vesicle structural protein